MSSFTNVVRMSKEEVERAKQPGAFARYMAEQLWHVENLQEADRRLIERLRSEGK